MSVTPPMNAARPPLCPPPSPSTKSSARLLANLTCPSRSVRAWCGRWRKSPIKILTAPRRSSAAPSPAAKKNSRLISAYSVKSYDFSHTTGITPTSLINILCGSVCPGISRIRTDSIRWVTAQWKDEPVLYNEGEHPSPFLAQRFDDGVLHVTVQDEHCRCKVASAPNPDGSKVKWKDGPIPEEYCEWSKPSKIGETCKAALKAEYGANPDLPSALGQWVEMSYRVEAGRSGKAVIEVHADGRFIVRVTGKIGYEPDTENPPTVTKFKVGHYRDYMPFLHFMEIDWLKVAPPRTL